MTLSHWDEVEPEVRDVGEMRATFRALGAAAGASAVGVSLIDVEPGCRPGPVHQHGSEEEIFFVLAGSGLAWIDGAVHEIGVGDTLVYLAGGPFTPSWPATTGCPCSPTARTTRRRSCACRAPGWSAAAASGSRPPATTRSSARRPPARSSCPIPRRARRAASRWRTSSSTSTRSARSTPPSATSPPRPGSVRTGLRHVVVAPGALNCPPHWHAAEHELFVVLEGDGTLLLYDNRGELAEEHALRPGIASRARPGMRLAHALRAGAHGMTYLAYGTREPGEIVYYPRSKKAWLGRVLVRLELADDYWEGED